MHLNRKVILKKSILKDCMLISKMCAYSRGVLVLAVFVQDGIPALVSEGRLTTSESGTANTF